MKMKYKWFFQINAVKSSDKNFSWKFWAEFVNYAHKFHEEETVFKYIIKIWSSR